MNLLNMILTIFNEKPQFKNYRYYIFGIRTVEGENIIWSASGFKDRGTYHLNKSTAPCGKHSNTNPLFSVSQKDLENM